MQKYAKRSIVLGCVAAASLVIFAGTTYGQEDYKAKYDKLKKEYDGVVIDRNNILQQTKSLIEIKAKYQNSQDEINKANAEKNAALKEVEAARQLTGPLKEQISSLEGAKETLRKEAEEAKKALETRTRSCSAISRTCRSNSSAWKNCSLMTALSWRSPEGRSRNLRNVTNRQWPRTVRLRRS
jgi:DNA repair exonuclease SbcCD ATPase subunit